MKNQISSFQWHRYVAISGCLLACGITFARPLQTHKLVTLDAPGWSLKRICASISEQIGLEVEPHGDIVNNTLIVHVRNVPWPELQKKLAWVEYGKWYMSGKALTLEQDKTQVRARIQQQIEARAKQLSENLEKDRESRKQPSPDANQLAREVKSKADEIEKKQDTDSGASARERREIAEANALTALENDLPLNQILPKIVESIPPAELASMAIGSRIVFSTHPTSLQNAFPPSAQVAISEMITKQAQVIKAMSAEGIDLGPFQGSSKLDPISAQDTITLSIKPSLGFETEATLRVFDPSGILIFTKSQEFGYDRAIADSASKPSSGGYGTLTPVQVQDYRALLLEPPGPSSSTLFAKLRNPAKYDPLQISLEPIVQAIAGRRNVIIDDDILMIADELAASFKNGNEVPLDIFSSPYMQAVSDSDPDSNWIGLRDNLIFLDVHGDVPRGPYADLVQAIHPDGMMEFIPAMRFTAACGPNLLFGVQVFGMFIGPLTYGVNPLSQEQQAYDIFRLVGSLDDRQIAHTQSKEGLDITSLPSESLKIFKSILLSKFNAGFSLGAPPSVPHKPTIMDEPTYAFANNLPSALLTIIENDQSVIKYILKYNGKAQPGYFSTDPVGLAKLVALSTPSPWTCDFSHLMVTPQKDITIVISFPGTKLTPVIADFKTKAHSPETYNGWQDLPPDLKQQVQDELTKLRSSAPVPKQ